MNASIIARKIAEHHELPYAVELLIENTLIRLLDEGVPADIAESIVSDFVDGMVKVT
jgi:hypothetical protein